LGLNTQIVAQTLRAAVHGTKATSIPNPDQDIDVVVKLNLNSTFNDPSETIETTLDTINNISIPSPQGPVLLGSVLSNTLGISNGSIAHLDKKRIEKVTGYTDGQTTTLAVTTEFQKLLTEKKLLPDGVTVSYGGEDKQVKDSQQQMLLALVSGLVAMFMILIVSFNSIRYTFYLLSIVPLSLIGVFGGLALTGQPVSFSSLLGIIALGGVIINHAIILMDSMLHLHHTRTDLAVIDVVIESSAIRLRPIFLTTITTAIGMIPLTLASTLWGPLAFTIMFGLTFAIILTLVLIPVLFYRHEVKVEEKKKLVLRHENSLDG
jgi:multidrug efflux pump subunit AcrB